MSNQEKAFQLLKSTERLYAAGRLADAEAACREALRLQPEHPVILHLLGVTLGRMGRLPESLEVLARAAKLQPNSAPIRQNYAFALKSNGQIDQAIREFSAALKLDPKLASAHSNLGVLYKDLGRWDEAKACYRRAIALKPDFADAHWNLALVLLRLGELKEGWAEYEWRNGVRTASPPPNLPMPRWNGEDLAGRSILLYAEQGLGDAIQFSRYIPLVASRGGKVAVAVPPELREILARSFPMAEFIEFGGNLPPVDVQCSLVGLPFVFGTELSSIPAQIPYLKADEEIVTRWARTLQRTDARPRAGIAWAGNPAHYNDKNRSIAPDELRPIFERKDVQLFSLQKGLPHGVTVPGELADFTMMLDDFDQTAGLIQNLDLVITVDTSVAHLAGALGKETWLLLPSVPDWRWLLDREDSPWYPGMTLFRQRTAGKWSDVVQEVVRELDHFKVER